MKDSEKSLSKEELQKTEIVHTQLYDPKYFITFLDKDKY